MKDPYKAMVVAAFAADSLALGVHWIYDTNLIDRKYGRVESLLKPADNSYHSTKDRGEFTHYGDQMLLLLASIAQNAAFDLAEFSQSWRTFFKTYKGYCDEATKNTLANLAQGKNPETAGSESSDLSGAARISPLIYRYRDKLDRLIDACRAQAAMTHNNPQVLGAAEFFARAVWKILGGRQPVLAFQEVMKENLEMERFSRWANEAVASREMDTRAAILKFGQECALEAAFPATIHLVAKYQENLKDALIENVMAGGDSAGRGMAVGMLLGAHLGFNAIPREWVSELKQYQTILEHLETIGRTIES
jgi:ADP-ribosylglycohydrolase